MPKIYTPDEILNIILRSNPKIRLADIQSFVSHYSQTLESSLSADVKRAQRMGLTAKLPKLVPPAGLRAKQAIPIMATYVREDLSKPLSLSESERSSFAAFVEGLDKRFGPGFAKRVIDAINAQPNGSASLHYKR